LKVTVATEKKSMAANRSPVIVKKGPPATRELRISGRLRHPTRDVLLGYVEAEHEQFAVDAPRSQSWVVRCHSENQIPHFAGDPPSANPLPDLGDHAPVEAKARAIQRTTVSGAMTSSDFFQSDQNRRARTQKSLSNMVRFGRRFRRLHIPSCRRIDSRVASLFAIEKLKIAAQPEEEKAEHRQQ